MSDLGETFRFSTKRWEMGELSVTYDFSEESFEPYLGGEPETYVVSDDVAFFVGSDGFLWFCMAKTPHGRFDWVYSNNAYLYDESLFGPVIPEDVRSHAKAMIEALSVASSAKRPKVHED